MAANIPSSQRVVVTGIGVVSSIGTGRTEFWQNLLDGKNGVTPVTSFDTADLPVSIGGEIKDFDPRKFIREAHMRSYGRASQLGIAATLLALRDSELSPAEITKENVGLFIGTTMGECGVQEDLVDTWVKSGREAMKLEDFLKLPDSILPLNICRELGLKADCKVFPTACAAGNYAIGYGYDQIRMGQASRVLAGGCDAFSKIAFIGFARMQALAPEKCQPFDKNRKGIVIGEGAGVVVLESLERALARKAKIYAEVLGYGMSCDAHHMTIPQVDGIVAVMDRALKDSGVKIDEVSLICAHGTGTPMNDKTEYQAIYRIFGDLAHTVPINSIKSMLGHTMGAASALEAIACILAIHDSKIPPTINFETPDEECPVDCVPNKMRETRVDVALNNSFAFGGNNAATVFARFR